MQMICRRIGFCVCFVSDECSQLSFTLRLLFPKNLKDAEKISTFSVSLKLLSFPRASKYFSVIRKTLFQAATNFNKSLFKQCWIFKYSNLIYILLISNLNKFSGSNVWGWGLAAAHPSIFFPSFNFLLPHFLRNFVILFFSEMNDVPGQRGIEIQILGKSQIYIFKM